MNSFFLIFIGVPILEILLMIELGGKIGALYTICLIFLTAVVGIYFAKRQGIQTLRSGIINLYQNKTPIYELISGASIALAAFLLIIPGFITDFFGFLLLVPFTRKLIVQLIVKRKNNLKNKNQSNILDGEIIEDKKDEL